MNNNIENTINLSKGIKLLYVEDNENSRIEVLEILEIFFQDIIVAVDGVEGLEKFRNNDIDLIITDIHMPNMDGLTMANEIRKENQDIPIVVFSAYEETNYLLKVIELQIDGFLSKPISLDSYIKTMYKVLKNINTKKELSQYKLSLELKVKEQLEELLKKDKIIQKHAKMAAMGEMIDIIAHQWKQPLNIISIKTSFLAEFALDDEPLSNEKIIKCGKDVETQIQHLTSTLDEFRGFFRPTKNIESVNLKELFDSLTVLLKDDLVKHQIDLNLHFSDIKLDINKNEFQHIFINLINNARDAFIQNSIQNRIITIEAIEDETNLIIKIKDNAGGIPQNIIQNIFEPNFTTKENIGGTGIGLYICKTIANKYNSTIDVEVFDGCTQFILDITK